MVVSFLRSPPIHPRPVQPAIVTSQIGIYQIRWVNQQPYLVTHAYYRDAAKGEDQAVEKVDSASAFMANRVASASR